MHVEKQGLRHKRKEKRTNDIPYFPHWKRCSPCCVCVCLVCVREDILVMCVCRIYLAMWFVCVCVRVCVCKVKNLRGVKPSGRKAHSNSLSLSSLDISRISYYTGKC